MKSRTFPTCAAEACEWAKRHGEPEDLAIRRWIKFAALDCLARDHALCDSIILRGSLALSFYDPTNRLAADIDIYSTTLPAEADEGVIAALVEHINKAMHTWLPLHFPDIGRWSTRIKREIKVEIMRLEYAVQWNTFRLPPPSNRPIRVATLECLIAEKLFAIVRQPRDILKGLSPKSRSKDILDICHVLRQRTQTLDLEMIISQFEGQRTVHDDNFSYTIGWFGNQVKSLVAIQYSGKVHDKSVEIAFEEAWDSVVSLVETMSRAKR